MDNHVIPALILIAFGFWLGSFMTHNEYAGRTANEKCLEIAISPFELMQCTRMAERREMVLRSREGY